MSGRLLSGIRATGQLHLGNYLGALRQWVDTQAQNDCFYFIADLHGLTDAGRHHDAKAFAESRFKTAATYLSAGLDPTKVTLFLQSAVPQHTELMWYLATVARKGELERMTQWKDKAGGNQAGASAALFVYPVLMASDILLYDADQVPVGDDQRQHVEVARDWATRFNSYYGDTFVIPSATTPPIAARIMDLQRPGSKMSKSARSQEGTLFIDDSPDELRDKIRRAVTDGGREIRRAPDKPGLSNLIDIYSGISNVDYASVEERFIGATYAVFKDAVADEVIRALSPIREGAQAYVADRDALARVLTLGAERAQATAEATCARARQSLGVTAL